VPVPHVLSVRLYSSDGWMVFDDPDQHGHCQETQVPEELYLHEFMDLDCGDESAVVAFCEKYGPIGRHDWSDHPGSDFFAFERPVPEGENQALLRGVWESGMWSEEELEVIDLVPHAVDHVSKVGFYQDAMANLINLWRCCQGQRTTAEADDQWRGGLWWRNPRDDPPTTLRRGLNRGLGRFHVRVREKDLSESPLDPGVYVYEAMCLQLANHIAEGLPYLTCAAEDCQNLFVRTEGYSRYGQNRLRGNKYCSVRCANRQHQRDWRRRKAAEKRQAGGTTPPDTSTEGSTP
jgi:hypothetical protein